MRKNHHNDVYASDVELCPESESAAKKHCCDYEQSAEIHCPALDASVFGNSPQGEEEAQPQAEPYEVLSPAISSYPVGVAQDDGE